MDKSKGWHFAERILLLGLVLVAILACTACASGNSSSPYVPPTGYTPVPGEPPIDKTWISPGKVEVGNFYSGAEAEYPLTVHNGNDSQTTFAVTYRIPDHVASGYSYPPEEAQTWVIIADSTPVIAPYGTVDIAITLQMPKGTDAPDEWEFWVSVMDESQTGMVHTEICSRWLIDMR